MGEWTIYVRRTPDGWEAGYRRGGTHLRRGTAANNIGLLQVLLPDLVDVLDQDDGQEQVGRLARGDLAASARKALGR